MTGHRYARFRSFPHPIEPRLPASRAAAVLLVSALAILISCSSSPTAPPPYDILSPTSDTVSVLPDGTVRFEIRADPGVTVEYVVDNGQPVPGPIFLYTPPTSGLHTVTAVIRSTSPATTLLEKDFAVVVEVPGNLPPEVVSLTVAERSETDGIEAVRDSAFARAVAVDPDGSVRSIAIDFGDDTAPKVHTGKETTFEAGHVYAAAGQYWVKVTVIDSVKISTSDSTQIQVIPANQLPIGTLIVSGDTEGEAPLTVTLRTSGHDPDGTITKWELDEEGDGTFRTIQPQQEIQVSYEFSEDTYRPALRLTDNRGDSVTIESSDDILVFRSISPSTSTTEGVGNPALSAPGNPIIWADGQDRLTISVVVRDPQGNPLSGVPIRITSLRPPLVAADGSTSLGSTVDAGAFLTGSNGRADGFLTTDTSTRVEAVPLVGSIPFDVRVEASRGHGEWLELDRITGVEASSVVDTDGGRFFVVKAVTGGAYCPGDTVEIHVEAVDRSGLPARGKYTQILYAQFGNQIWFGARPAPPFANWRTNQSGEIVFTYVPTEADGNRIMAAWVDGRALKKLTAFNFKPVC